MNALLRHEMRGAWRTHGILSYVGFLLVIGFVWSLFGLRGGGAAAALLMLGALNVTSLVIAFGAGARAVRREWTDGTASLWLQLRYSEAARLSAKLIAALSRSLVAAVAIFALSVGSATALVALIPHLPAGLVGQAPTVSLPGFLMPASPGELITLVAQYGLGDFGLLLAWAPPLAMFGILLASLRPRRRTGRLNRSWLRFVLPWMVFAWCASLLLQFASPWRIVSLAGGAKGLHFLPAGRFDLYASVVPGFAVTLWPLLLTWLLAALLATGEIWWLRRRACAW